jgi:hypothetical protein
MKLYDSTIKNNGFMNRHTLHVYDNTRNNIGVSKRYNDYLSQQLPENAWIVFCHQDFYFEEDVASRLASLDPEFIYGPIGAGPSRQFILVLAASKYGLERCRMGFVPRTKQYGQITQKTPEKNRMKGQWICKPVIVDTVDCCCLIVHSSLVRKLNLTFDESLDWHLYAEDFCLNARFKKKVFTKAVQLKCTHLSGGTMDSAFHEALHYLKKKHATDSFATTCYDGYMRF